MHKNFRIQSFFLILLHNFSHFNRYTSKGKKSIFPMEQTFNALTIHFPKNIYMTTQKKKTQARPLDTHGTP